MCVHIFMYGDIIKADGDIIKAGDVKKDGDIIKATIREIDTLSFIL